MLQACQSVLLRKNLNSVPHTLITVALMKKEEKTRNWTKKDMDLEGNRQCCKSSCSSITDYSLHVCTMYCLNRYKAIKQEFSLLCDIQSLNEINNYWVLLQIYEKNHK